MFCRKPVAISTAPSRNGQVKRPSPGGSNPESLALATLTFPPGYASDRVEEHGTK
jgi:hypothetical protein